MPLPTVTGRPPEESAQLGEVIVIEGPIYRDFESIVVEHPPVKFIVAVIVAVPVKVPLLVNVLEVPEPEGNVAAELGFTDQVTEVPEGATTLKFPVVQKFEGPDNEGLI